MENNYNSIKVTELRDHIRQCTFEAVNHFRQVRQFDEEYTLKLKSWALTIFLASAAYSIQKRDEIGNVFYFLPLIPVLLFGFLYAYKMYSIERYLQHGKFKYIEAAINNLYDYSYEELKEIAQKIYFLELNWQDKGKSKPKRFLFEKIPFIFKIIFINPSNLIFFGGIILSWLVIIFIIK